MNNQGDAPGPLSEDGEVRAYQAVGNSLLERIRSGEFRTVGKLPPERELAELYGVGRAVIRDALVMLEVKGLVQTRQGSGIYVTRQVYEEDPAESVDALPLQQWDSLAPAGPFEMVEAWQWLESHIARQAAIRATSEDLDAIEGAAEDHRKARLGQARDTLDFAFHMTIARATRNPELVGVVKYLWNRREANPLWKRLGRMTDPVLRAQAVADHRRIVEALRQRDGDRAFVAMWLHIDNSRAHFLAADAAPADETVAGPPRRAVRPLR